MADYRPFAVVEEQICRFRSLTHCAAHMGHEDGEYAF